MPDYMFLLESRLSAEQRSAMARIQELAIANGANLYLVGGAVRDLISGMSLRDLDFTVEGNPQKIVRELEKEGAEVTAENESLRHYELILSGDVDASISAAREDVYERPGAKPTVRFSTIMEDLRRRDFSINAIAISLNANSRGLLLDPTNGLADLERREIRALSIHSFTNQPVRMLRALRYGGRMDFKLDTRTTEGFKLAMERGLHQTISADDAGSELRQVASDEKPIAVLKAWESSGLLETLHAQLAKRHPDYEAVNRITRVRDEMLSGGFRPNLFAPVAVAILGRLKDRDLNSAIARMALRSSILHQVQDLEGNAAKIAKILTGPKTASPKEAYAYLETTPLDVLAYILAESSNTKAIAKIRNYLRTWKPLRNALTSVATELEMLGLERGPKFDKVLEDFFQAQLAGRARKLEDHAKLLRKLAGIKEPPKKPEEKKKPEKGKKPGEAPKGKPFEGGGGPHANRGSGSAWQKSGGPKTREKPEAHHPAKSAGAKRKN